MWERKKSWCKLSQPNGPRGSKLAQQYHILYAWNITIPRALLVASYFLDKQTSTGVPMLPFLFLASLCSSSPSRVLKNIVCPSPVTLAASKTKTPKTTRHSLRIASALSILYRNQSNILVMVHSSFTTSFKPIHSECVSHQLINRTTQNIKSKSTTFKTNYNLSKSFPRIQLALLQHSYYIILHPLNQNSNKIST